MTGSPKTFQAKDISTDDFLDAVRRLHAGAIPPWTHASVGLVHQLTGWPYKVIMAKVTKLDRQGLIEGCGCGCGSPIFITDGA